YVEIAPLGCAHPPRRSDSVFSLHTPHLLRNLNSQRQLVSERVRGKNHELLLRRQPIRGHMQKLQPRLVPKLLRRISRRPCMPGRCEAKVQRIMDGIARHYFSEASTAITDFAANAAKNAIRTYTVNGALYLVLGLSMFGIAWNVLARSKMIGMALPEVAIGIISVTAGLHYLRL